LIWLSGYDLTKYGYKDIFLDQNICKLPDFCKVILLKPSKRKVTFADNEIKSSWYDVFRDNKKEIPEQLNDEFWK
jgi:hypothetical protein